MQVYKFGGSSVGSPERMSLAAEIISRSDKPKIVVLSAMAGTTNALVQLAELCRQGKYEEALGLGEELHGRYRAVVAELLKSEKQKMRAQAFVGSKFDLIKNLAAGEFSIENEKIILAQGELLSTELFHYFLAEREISSALLPALNFMRTDRLQEPDIYYIRENLGRELEKHPDEKLFITQGYICINAWGEIDNLKRGGSDYSATLIGAAIKAEEVQIWTDIDGLHNNDPRIVEKTKSVAKLSYNEAEELAYFGAKILHPLCILPAHQYNIPVWLKSTLEPEAYGTYISGDAGREKAVKAISAKDGITAIKIQSARMMMAYGFLRRVFEIFERFETPIDMITTSEVAVSLTIEDERNLSKILHELRPLGTVSVDKEQSIICVVGQDIVMADNAMDIFSALKDEKPRMISYGGSSNNISLLIDSSQKKTVLQKLSRHLFGP